MNNERNVFGIVKISVSGVMHVEPLPIKLFLRCVVCTLVVPFKAAALEVDVKGTVCCYFLTISHERRGSC